MKIKTKAKAKKIMTLALAFVITAAMLFPAFRDNPPAVFIAEAAVSPNSLSNIGPRANSANDPARGIYVATNGNDSTATGSLSAPYKSINTALESAHPGDTIILRSGTYREGINVRVRTPNITIKSRKGEWAIIDLTTHDAGADEDSGVYFDVESSGGKLQGVEVKGGFYAVCMETKWDWGDPSDRVGASNILIEDCILHDSKYDVIKIKPNCNNVTIRYNEIYNSGKAFAGRPLNGEDNAEGIDNVNGDNMKVQNNYIHDICSNGVYAKGGATDALIENNRIERAYGAGIMVGFDTSPDFFDLAVNPRYYENIRGVVRNNLLIDIGWEGIGLYGSKDAKVYNNTLVNVTTGGQYHSAIYFGLTYQDWDAGAVRPANINPNIYNNIISQPSNIVRPMIEIRYAYEDELGGSLPALDGNPIMSNNCYYIAGKHAEFEDYRPGSVLESAGLSAWKTHIGGDAGSLEVNPSLGADYMPTNSQCTGMGLIPDSSSSSSSPTVSNMSNFKKVKIYKSAQFSDVNENDWYGYNKDKTISLAYEYDLMMGDSSNTFNPKGNITVAEIITLAARIHSIYTTGKTIPASTSNPWYQDYVDYAIKNGIIKSTDFKTSDYTRAATRAEMAYIISNALPESEFASKNTVKSLPDVNQKTPYYSSILLFYKAGILSGSDTKGTFNPGNNITRAEAATIISRVILPETRTSGKTFG